MLRRRIFSSAMASVMALTSIAVVANAEETKQTYTIDAVKDTADYVKTAEDLKALCDLFDDAWQLTKAEEEYTEENLALLNDALAYADAVLNPAVGADPSTSADYTVAWRMVYACAIRVKEVKGPCHDLADLKARLDDAKKIIDTNNIYQEEIMDRLYDADTFQNLRDVYSTLVADWDYHIQIGLAADAPEGYVESLDAKEIDSAWHAIDKAINDLKTLEKVTKSDFVKAITEYQELLTKKYAYESWRRNASFGPTDWRTYGDAFNTLEAADDVYLITENYEELIGYKNIKDTTKEDIVKAYKDCLNAIATFKTWKADSVTATTKIAVLRLMNDYSKQFAYAAYLAGQTSCADLYDAIVEFVGEDNITTTAFDWVINDDYDISGKIGQNKAMILLKGKDNDVFVPLDKDGKWVGSDVAPLSADNVDAKDYVEGVEGYQRISGTIEFDLATLIKADFGTEGEMFHDCPLLTGDNGQSPTIEYAYYLANEYIAGNFSLDDAIDTRGVIDVTKELGEGLGKEWDVVYRYVTYAINDHFTKLGFNEVGVSGDFHNRAQIQSLLKKCYALIEETAHAPIFSAANKNLVDTCEWVQEWLGQTLADKNYKDYKAGYIVGGVEDDIDDVKDGMYLDSSTVYHLLSNNIFGLSDDAYYGSATKACGSVITGAYDQLLSEYLALKLEYQDVYDMIAKVSAQIDAGEVEGNATVLAALNDAAFYLNAIDDVLYYQTGEYYDNAAFNELRDKFLGTNRVITNSKWDKATYIMTLEGSIYAYSGKDANGNDVSLNDSHYNLYNAYNALVNTAAGNVVPDYAKGDVNRDGSVNVLDASAILMHLAGKATLDAEQLGLADLDGNGNITVMDASEVLKIAKANA